tara:strand:+ start:23 stop:574 length:552 start_codon:yes stop_codon:yes gene_type:complete
MKLKLSAKFIFIILIVLIITILTSNYINRNSQLNSQKIQGIDPSKEGKTVGVNIVQNQPNGEKIKIIADLMEENKKEKLIKLINPITEIIKKNNITKITSNYGYIIDNYSKFKLNKNVNIYNNEKKFVLKTEELSGIFDTGDMYTNSSVKIKIKNSKIQGSSLSLKNYGEYIKVFGKVKLTID